MFIETVCEKGSCVGCGNCSNICPNHAITMNANAEGFLHPSIDYEKCVNCGLCEKKCPQNGLFYKECPDLPETLLVRLKEENVLRTCASGGICSLLARHFVEKKNGFVCGAVYDESFMVKHIVSNEMMDIEKMKSSKYVQSDLGSSFIVIKKKLAEHCPVLMIGTGCQIYALKKFLGKEYENLFCIDVICHGTPSPKVQKEYIGWLESINGKVSEINNRYKKCSAHGYKSTYKVVFSNGKLFVNKYVDDPMANAFFRHLSIRKSCFDCQFKTVHRISDLTVGDFWFSEMYGMGEDKLGINLCLIQSDKGKSLLDAVSSWLEVKQIEAETAIVQNGGMIYSSSKASPNRAKFFEKLGKMPFDKLVFSLDGFSRMDKARNFFSKFFVPLLQKTRYYNNQLKKSANARKKRKVPENKKGLMYYG